MTSRSWRVDRIARLLACLLLLAGSGSARAQTEPEDACEQACSQQEGLCIDACSEGEDPIECEAGCRDGGEDCRARCRE
jgi:hypothetical protein